VRVRVRARARARACVNACVRACARACARARACVRACVCVNVCVCVNRVKPDPGHFARRALGPPAELLVSVSELVAELAGLEVLVGEEVEGPLNEVKLGHASRRFIIIH